MNTTQNINYLSWLFATGRECAEGDLKFLLKFFVKGCVHKNELMEFHLDIDGRSAAEVLESRKKVFGALVWPYMCSNWSTEEKLEHILNHTKTTVALGSPALLTPTDKYILTDLQQQFDGLRIILDQPVWFLREGLLAINLFVHEYRAYTLAFSLYRTKRDDIHVYVGAIQGRKGEDSNKLYKQLTKSLYGIRPRDLLIEAFRNFCITMEVTRIHAVSDSALTRKDKYFSGASEVSAGYDSIWEERGGVPGSSGFHVLPIQMTIRDLESMPSKKRSAYRKKLAFFEELSQRINIGASKSSIIEFDAT